MEHFLPLLLHGHPMIASLYRAILQFYQHGSDEENYLEKLEETLSLFQENEAHYRPDIVELNRQSTWDIVCALCEKCPDSC